METAITRSILDGSDPGDAQINVTAGDFNPPMAKFRERISWALYDFANTVFSMNIATLYFSAWLIADLGHSNTLYATVNGIASAMVVVSIPVFGAISDATQRRKPWVVGFTLIACIATALIAVFGQLGLPLIGEGVTGSTTTLPISSGVALFGVLAAFTIANYTYQGAQPFYNAMMAELVPGDHRGRLSGLGAALGYVGSLTGVILTFPFLPDRCRSWVRFRSESFTSCARRFHSLLTAVAFQRS